MKSVFDALKKERGTIVGELDRYLLYGDDTGTDRKFNVNAPSAIGSCMRSRYFSRTIDPKDVAVVIDPRTRRIFGNGTHVHLRLQEDLIKSGVMLIDEIPVYSRKYNIQGHTDGLARVDGEYIVVEIKSIKQENFEKLIDAKPEHKKQGLIYLYCIEERRKYIQKLIDKNGVEAFDKTISLRRERYKKLYQHLKDGSKYTRDEKICFQASLHLQLDELLKEIKTPISRVSFIYENKNTQEIKEFSVYSHSEESKQIIREILNECSMLNTAVEEQEIPERPKNAFCRFCDYKDICETAGG